LSKPITEDIKKLPVSSLQNKLTTVTSKMEELKQAEIGATQESTDILKQSINKLRDQQTRIVSILDSIKESSEMKDILILISKRPNVKRWLAGEDVELDEADQNTLRVINKLSTDKLGIVKEYAKVEAEDLPSNTKKVFALNDQNIENMLEQKNSLVDSNYQVYEKIFGSST